MSQPPQPPPDDRPTPDGSRHDQPTYGQPGPDGPARAGQGQPAHGQPAYRQSGDESTPRWEPQPGATQPGQGYASAGGPAPSKGLAVTALVLGILGLLLCWVPIVGVALAILAIVFGIVAVRRPAGKGMAITGLVLGVLALIAGAIFSVIWYFAYTVGQDCIDETGVSSGPAFEQCIEDRARDLGS